MSRQVEAEMTMMRWRWAVVITGLGLYMLAIGFLGGLAAERLRLDQRADVLTRLQELTEWLRGRGRDAEGPTRASDGKPWTAAMRNVTEALMRHDVAAAERRLQEAYMSAVASRGWEGLLEVGDAHRRLGEVSGAQAAADVKAREAYRAGLLRAHQQRSLDGVLRAAEAFAALGDQEVATLGLRMAEGLAGRDPEAQADVRAAAARLGHPPGEAAAVDDGVGE